MVITKKQINLISLIFFLSGSSALMFETVWFRIASTVLGSSIWSAAAVLMAFMTGLGLGNILIAWYGRKIKKPVAFYIILEVIIGFSGLLSVLLLPLLSPIITHLAVDIVQGNSILNLIRFSLAFTAFLIPAVAMGATLPVLQKILYAHDASFVRSFARLYGWNTLGAVAGILFAEFWLISILGLKGSALVASLINLLAALILLRSFKNHTIIFSNEKSFQDEVIPGKYKRLLIAPFMSGLILLALEVIWFRYLILLTNGTSIVFATMLATVLIGIGIGGILATRLTYRHYNLDKALNYLLSLATFSVVAGYYINNQLAIYFYFETQTNIIYFTILALVLMLPTSIITGMLFPLFAEKVFRHLPETTRASGMVTFINTLGAAIGSGLATFLFLPVFGIEQSLFVLAAAYLVVLFINRVTTSKTENFLRTTLLPITGIIVILVLFPFGTLNYFYHKASIKRYPDEELVKVKESLNETLRYHKKKLFGETLNHRLITNNHSMSATGFSANRYMKLYAYFPYIFHGNIKDVLQISYGVGNTAEAITRLEDVEIFDIVDISKDILDLSYIIHNDTRWFPLNDKRVTVHIEDGRFYLQTTKHTYDLITGEPPPPKMSGIVNLYSEEYFKLMKSRLNSGGIVTYWLPVHSLHEGDTLSIIKAFCSAFSDCSLWNGGGLDFMLVGSNGGLKPLTETRLNNIWDSYLAVELKKIGLEKPGQLGALYIADNKSLALVTEHTLPVTDDFPHKISPSIRDLSIESNINLYLLDTKRRKAEFRQSTFIQKLFPKALLNEIISDFKVESMLTKVAILQARNNDLEYWQDLHYLLTKTNLKTAPLRYLYSSPNEQILLRKIKPLNSRDYLIKKAKGLLSNRDYLSATALLENHMENKDIKSLPLYDLKLYYYIKALAKDVTINELKQLQPRSTPEKEYLEWNDYVNWIVETVLQKT